MRSCHDKYTVVYASQLYELSSARGEDVALNLHGGLNPRSSAQVDGATSPNHDS